MESKLKYVITQIDNGTFFKDTGIALKPFHIFFEMKNFFKDQLEKEEVLKMYKQHLKNERCLSLLRQKNFIGANEIMSDILKMDRSYSSLIQFGMDSLYNAMSAYYDHIILHDNRNAIDKLKISIEKGILQSLSYPYFSLSVPTQWINVLRVLIKRQDTNAVIEEFTSLVYLTLFGIHKNHTLVSAYQTLQQPEHLLVLNDVFDAVIYAIDRSYNPQKANDIFKTVMSKVLDIEIGLQSNNPSIINALFLLDSYHKKYSDSFWLDNLIDKPESFKDLPESLKFKIYSAIKTQMENQSRIYTTVRS